jgi:hypothetical protein
MAVLHPDTSIDAKGSAGVNDQMPKPNREKAATRYLPSRIDLHHLHLSRTSYAATPSSIQSNSRTASYSRLTAKNRKLLSEAHLALSRRARMNRIHGTIEDLL